MTTHSDQPIAIRASSFGELFDCAHRWEWKYLFRRHSLTSGAAHLGTAIHAGTAAFDHAQVAGRPIKAVDAVDQFLETLHHPEGEVNWMDISPKAAEPIGARLTSAYCLGVAPHYNYSSVEMSLNPLEITCDNGVVIRLTGTMDRARVSLTTHSPGRESLGIVDLKTGKRAVGTDNIAITKGHGAQLGTYELLAEHTLDRQCNAPAEIIGLQTTKQARIGTAKVFGAKQMLIGTPDTPGLIEYAADTLKSGMFRPNPQSRLCSPQYCPRWDACKFHE